MRFALLGPCEVLVGDAGEELSLRAPRLRVLLAALLLQANRAVSFDTLAELVWDGRPPSAARPTLRSHVMRLRRALGQEAGARVLAREPGYLIRVSEAELDVLEFEALCGRSAAAMSAGRWREAWDMTSQALDLWRASPLADVASETLREAFVPRLEQMRLQVLERRMDIGLRLGRHDVLVSELRGLIASQPLRERFYAQLMLALAGLGQVADALAAYRAARRVLVKELGIEPGPELRALQQKILTGDIKAITPRLSTPGTVNTVPRQLPVGTRLFTGRQMELATLFDLTKESSSPDGAAGVIAIDGMAGIGKTALAVHAAHRLSERFPDGQLFFDLHGYTQGYQPRTPGDALAWFLRALGIPPQQIPQDAEERAALFRQRLAGTRTLIVLDNANTVTQVRSLLPGTAGCLTLVTSRKRLRALDDAHVLTLDVLPTTDAITLLSNVADTRNSGTKNFDPANAELANVIADDQAWIDIAAWCGHLPLALRIAAALLRHRPAWTPEHLADLLRDQHQRIDVFHDGERDLNAIFDLSYLQLPAAAQHMLRCLGSTPGPDTDIYAAAALSRTDPGTARDLLENLVDHNLLTAHAVHRYRLHDLLRLYARAKAAGDPADQRAAALSRLLDYYVNTANAADRHLARRNTSFIPTTPGTPIRRPDLTSRARAADWMNAELANLTAAVDQAAGSHAHHAVALSAAMHGYLYVHGPWAQAMTVHTTAAEAARRLMEPLGEATALTDLGRMQRLSGRHAAASETLTQALELHRKLTDSLGEANALTELGYVRHQTGDSPGAEDALTQALKLHQEIDDRLGQTSALNGLGLVRELTGNYQDAKQAHQQALQLSRELDDELGQGNALNGLARTSYHTADYPAAAEALEQALELYRRLGDRQGQGYALHGLGRVRGFTGDHSGAIDAFQHALAMFAVVGSPLGQGQALTSLGRIRRLTGDYSGAIQILQRALELYLRLGDRLGQSSALLGLGQVHEATGDNLSAIGAHLQALRLCHEADFELGQAMALRSLGRVRRLTGDHALADQTLQQALHLYRNLDSRLGQANTLADISSVRYLTGDHSGARRAQRQATRLFRELGDRHGEADALRGIGETHLPAGENGKGPRRANPSSARGPS